MDWLKSLRYKFWPSRVLGFLLLCEFSAGLALVLWQQQLPACDPFKFLLAQWILSFAAGTAMVGWTTSAIVTVRNSVKQHTISTLLQSRMSSLYMEHAKTINKHFITPDRKVLPLTEEDLNNPELADALASLTYILNYFEFIALGIRYGDLHHGLMKGSMRGFLCNIFQVAKLKIDLARKPKPDKTVPKVFEHLAWLHGKWLDEKLQLPVGVRLAKKVTPRKFSKFRQKA